MARYLFQLTSVTPAGSYVRLDSASGSTTPTAVSPVDSAYVVPGAVLRSDVTTGALPTVAAGVATLYQKTLNASGGVTATATLTGTLVDGAGPGALEALTFPIPVNTDPTGLSASATSLASNAAFTGTYAPLGWRRRDAPAPSVALPRLTGSPPTLTDTTDATALSNPKSWTLATPADGSVDGTHANLWGPPSWQSNATYGNTPTAITGISGGSSMRYYYEFVTDAPTFELRYYRGSADPDVRITIDGQYVQETALTLTTNTSPRRLRVATASGARKLRRVLIESRFLFLNAIVTTTADTVFRPRDEGIRVAWLMDSYGQANTIDALQYVASSLLGWKYVYTSCEGGSGFTLPGGGTTTFVQRVPEVLLCQPDVIVVCGGINDGTTGLAAAVASTFSALRAGRPLAQIFACGPWTPHTSAVTGATAKRDIISANATPYGAKFIDPTLWVTGEGNVSSPTAGGNSDVVISSDNTHPTADGSAYLGARLAFEMSSQIAG